MTAVHPFITPILWLRFLVAAALILWLPGRLLVGRHLRSGSWLDRGLISCAVGLLLVPMVSAPLRWLDLPLRPWTFLPLALALGLVLGRSTSWRNALGSLDLTPAPTGRHLWLVLACCLLLLTGALVGFSDYCVPPDFGDGTNHAFMVQRVAITGSTAAPDLFPMPLGTPRLTYLPGWHTSAALVAMLSGVAPYVSMWFLAMLATCFLPAVLGLLWRRWGFSIPALTLAAAFVAANHKMPLGLFSWGGYGILMGTFLVPWCVLLLERTWRGGSLPLAALAGLSLGALLHVHATEVLLAVLLSLLTLSVAGREGARPGWRHVLFLLLGLSYLGVEVVLNVLGQYLHGALGTADFTMHRLGHTFEIFLHAAGRWQPLQLLWALGLIMGVAMRRTRPLAVAAVVVGTVAGSLSAFRDPISLFLTTPFYAQAHRVYDVLIYLMAPLMTLPVAVVWRRSAGRRLGPAAPSTVVTVLLVATFVLPAQRSIQAVYRDTRVLAPMAASDFEHARLMADVVDPDEWVANQYRDGSLWAGHVSGRRFLVPTMWQLGIHEQTRIPEGVAGLVQRPWPPESLALRELGTTYLYARDRQASELLVPDFLRADVEGDDRFEPVLRGENATLYRIRWANGQKAEGRSED